MYNRVPEGYHQQQNFHPRRDPFDEVPSLNPFRIMREFERMFEDDFDIFPGGETGEFGRHRGGDGFFDDFFGHRTSMRPSSYSHTRDPDDEFGGFFQNGHSFFSSPHAGPVAFFINDQPNFRGNFEHESQPSQEVGEDFKYLMRTNIL